MAILWPKMAGLRFLDLDELPVVKEIKYFRKTNCKELTSSRKMQNISSQTEPDIIKYSVVSRAGSRAQFQVK